MELHAQFSDAEFAARFERCELPLGSFTHEAHLRLAWIHIARYGAAQAEANIIRLLLQYVKHVGAEDKFHQTVTVAAVRIVARCMAQSGTKQFDALLQEFPALKTDFNGLLQQHYSFDVFESERARTAYLPPDLLTLE